MRKLTVAVVALALAAFSAAVALAFTNPPSMWSGTGWIWMVSTLDGQKDSTWFRFTGPMTASTTDIDFGTPNVIRDDAPSLVTTTVIIFQDAKPTSRNAKIEKNPNQQRRAQVKALAAQLYGLAKVPGKAAPLDMTTLGDVQIDEASITAGGSFKAIKNFTKTKGTATLKYTFTVVGGPHDGRSGKGTIKLTFDGNRVF